MRILVHDYGAYNFPLQLSQNLALKGYEVFHLYGENNQALRGDFSVGRENLRLIPIATQRGKNRKIFVFRWFQEREYGKLLATHIKNISPDLVLSANTPLESQRYALEVASKMGIPFFFWVQDLLGPAAYDILIRKYSFPGGIIGEYFIRLEKKLLKKSSQVICISPQMADYIKEEVNINSTIIPNWAVQKSILPHSRSNTWSEKHQLSEKFTIIYTGNLGYKYSVEYLLEIAEKLKHIPVIRLVVVGEGVGFNRLKDERSRRGLNNLMIFGFQTYDDYPLVLASADILFAYLDHQSRSYSYPSKVLSYLCANKPILFAIQKENWLAYDLADNNAAKIIPENDVEAAVEGILQIKENNELRDRLSMQAKLYAEVNFNIENISRSFERLIQNRGGGS